MMRRATASLALVAGLGLAGTALAIAPEAPPPGADKAFVYLYRTPTLFNSGRQASFFLDGEKVVDLWAGGCVRLEVTPGPHLLEEQWKAIPIFDIGETLTSKEKRVAVRETWLAGGVYLYRLNVWQAGGYGYQEIRWDLLPNDPATALAKVSKCKSMTWTNPGQMEQPGAQPSGAALAPNGAPGR